MASDLGIAIIGAIGGLISGTAITLIGPIIGAKIKNAENRNMVRKECIDAIIRMISESKTLQEIGESYEYRKIKPYLCEEIVKHMHPITQQKDGGILVSVFEPDLSLYVTDLIKDELSKLEYKWKIV